MLKKIIILLLCIGAHACGAGQPNYMQQDYYTVSFLNMTGFDIALTYGRGSVATRPGQYVTQEIIYQGPVAIQNGKVHLVTIPLGKKIRSLYLKLLTEGDEIPTIDDFKDEKDFATEIFFQHAVNKSFVITYDSVSGVISLHDLSLSANSPHTNKSDFKLKKL